MPIDAIDSGDRRVDTLGLNLQSLLQIILTQLTHQDPLKPVDNFEFVSQLAQFTQLEQARQMTERLEELLAVQSATQTLGLLGRAVDAQVQGGTVAGLVKSISFAGSQPQLVLETADGTFLTNATVDQIIQVRQEK
jgi:flagellar basal-body rod modification protein FlgD